MNRAARIFTVADQMWFATVSGDANPLHVDPVWAAAVFPGDLVVHGMHAVLWGLEQCFAEWPGLTPGMIHATFVRPIVVGDEVSRDVVDQGGMVRLFVRGEPVLVIRLRPGPPPQASGPVGITDASPAAQPRERAFDALKGLRGEVAVPSDAGALAAAFPGVAAALGPAMLTGLAALSTLVGMECPGLRSMFSEFSVTRDDSAPVARLAYHVKRFDPIFSRVDMAVGGLGLTGTVSAFAGQADSPPTDADIQALVSPGEFAGAAPLVVGASGGLGAVTARLLAAGGATPLLTWNQSRAGVDATARSIAALGGRCDRIQLDAGAVSSGLAALAAAGWSGDQVYYFATPRIFRRRLDLYQGADLRAFLDIYVDGFYALVRGLLKLRGDAPLRLFYPSTVAVTDSGADLLEYGMAKLAGERLCARLEEKYKTLSITIARLPRIATRQTQNFIRLPAESPQRVMLPIVRSVQGGG